PRIRIGGPQIHVVRRPFIFPWCGGWRGALNPGSPSILVLPRLIEDFQHLFQRRRFRQGTAKVLETSDGPEDDCIATVFHDESTSLLDPMTLAKLDRNRGLAPPSDLDDLPMALHGRIQHLLPEEHSYSMNQFYALQNPIRIP